MKKKFTIIANCQTSIADFLLSNPVFLDEYEFIQLYGVHTTTQENVEYIYKILNEVDLLLIQPINDNYKGIDNFGTYNIILKTKKSCKIILFPSLYLKFYYPFCSYITNKTTNVLLQQPIDYHDINLLNICKKYSSFETVLEQFKKMVYDTTIITNNELSQIFEESINELKKRENEYPLFIPDTYKINSSIILSSDFIYTNYKNKLLFYSMNHPTKYLFHYISDCILSILYIPLMPYKTDIDPLLHNNVPILYKSINNYVNFDTSEYPIIINNEQISIDKFVKIYYDVYSTLNLSEY